MEETITLETEMSGKCFHGRNRMFCCECRYGCIREERERPRDMVDDMNMQAGYRLVSGFALHGRKFEEL